MSAKTPTVSAGRLYDPHQPDRVIVLDSPTWFTWLASAHARSFAYPLFDAHCGYILGYMTVRKEGRQRGSSYWTVYRRSHGQVRKIYLGTASQVTRARLVAVVRALLAAHYQCAEAEIRITQHH
jgi:hypothetical protein